MITILCLLSLLASDCRVHRADWIPEVQYTACCFEFNRETGKVGGPCLVESHYVDTCKYTVVEKCDTVHFESWKTCYPPIFDRGWDSVICHPETTLVDSGVVDDEPINIGKSGDVKVWNGKRWEWRAQALPLDSAELADIRAMLREWRVEECVKATKFMMPDPPVIDWQLDGWWKEYERKSQAVRDSCECAVEGAKK